MKIISGIGYGNRPPEKFVELLKEHDIKVVLDVRRQGTGAWNFSYKSGIPIMKMLWEHGILYVPQFNMGNHSDKESLAEKLEDYNKWLSSPAGDLQLQSLEMTVMALESCGKVAIMCACKDVLDCHRQIIVARMMRRMGSDAGGEWEVKHIREEKKL